MSYDWLMTPFVLCRGLIGPQRQFGQSSIYYPEVFAVIVGVFLPIPFWYWQRKRPNRWNGFIAIPVVLSSIQFIPPATGINYSSWIIVGFIFQFWIRRNNFPWWSKFNYVTSAALDIGMFYLLRTSVMFAHLFFFSR
jgi:hypothetical protein